MHTGWGSWSVRRCWCSLIEWAVHSSFTWLIKDSNFLDAASTCSWLAVARLEWAFSTALCSSCVISSLSSLCTVRSLSWSVRHCWCASSAWAVHSSFTWLTKYSNFLDAVSTCSWLAVARLERALSTALCSSCAISFLSSLLTVCSAAIAFLTCSSLVCSSCTQNEQHTFQVKIGWVKSCWTEFVSIGSVITKMRTYVWYLLHYVTNRSSEDFDIHYSIQFNANVVMSHWFINAMRIIAVNVQIHSMHTWTHNTYVWYASWNDNSILWLTVFRKSSSFSVNFLQQSAHHCKALNGNGYRLTVSGLFTVAEIVEVKMQRPRAARLSNDMWIKASARILVVYLFVPALLVWLCEKIRMDTGATGIMEIAIEAVIVKMKSRLWKVKSNCCKLTLVLRSQPPFGTKWWVGDARCGLTLQPNSHPPQKRNRQAVTSNEFKSHKRRSTNSSLLDNNTKLWH